MKREVFVHARPVSGTFGDAKAAVVSGGQQALFELPGRNQHIGAASYLVVIRALELAAQAGEKIVLKTSYKTIAQNVNGDRCGSAALRPMFLRTRQLVIETGSSVEFVPGLENPAVSAVLEAWRAAGRTVAFKGRSAPRTRPRIPDLSPGLRAALIDAGWTPPKVAALAS